jgi:ABC-type transport system involved in multi-copper enzyme maturation permease subunit
MTALVRAEFRKLFSTRLWLWLLLGSLGFTALGCVVIIALDGNPQNAAPPLSTDAGLRNLFATAAAGNVFAIVLGAIGMTSEFRHLTATPTFLATPHRGRVVAAKLLTYAMAGAGYGLASVMLVLAIALTWLPAKGIHISPTGDGIPAVLLAAVAALAVYSVLGVGVGALVRNQIAAVVGTLIYLLVLEAILSVVPVVRDYYRYLPGGALNALIRSGASQVPLLAPWQGGLLLLGYGLVLAGLGAALAVRRDIT